MVTLTTTQEPINNGSKPQKACFQRKFSITKITLAFVFRTKVHGLRYVFAPDKSKPRRFFWFLAISVCLALFFVWSWNRLLYLLSFPAITKIYMMWTNNMTFPAVTLCNQNLVRVSSLTKADLYHSGYWMDIVYANHSVNRQSVAMLKHSRHRERLMRLLDFSDYVPPHRFHLNTTEMIGRLSHQLEDMLLECKFRGERCTHKNFTPVRPVCMSGAHVMQFLSVYSYAEQPYSFIVYVQVLEGRNAACHVKESAKRRNHSTSDAGDAFRLSFCKNVK